MLSAGVDVAVESPRDLATPAGGFASAGKEADGFVNAGRAETPVGVGVGEIPPDEHDDEADSAAPTNPVSGDALPEKPNAT